MDIIIQDVYRSEDLPHARPKAGTKIRQRLVGRVVGVRSARRRDRKKSKRDNTVVMQHDPSSSKAVILLLPEETVLGKHVHAGQRVRLEFDSEFYPE